MTLTLTVLRCPPTVAPEVREVTGGEFSIGRGPDNQWVLPDPTKHLSKRHCVLAFRNGTWQVAGTSTNGTFVNRDEVPLESRGPHTVVDGDRLILGVYEIEIRLVEEAQPSWRRSAPVADGRLDPFGKPFDDDLFAPSPHDRAQKREADQGFASDPYSPALAPDFDPLLPDDEAAFPGETPADHSSAISDAINLPPAKVPDDWDLDDFAPPPVAKPSEREAARRPAAKPRAALPDPEVRTPLAAPTPPAVPAADGDLLAAFLRGAGMEEVALPDPVETMERLGAAFRAMVTGIRHALIARSEVKREFRIETTMIRTRGNNLLKFSANDDDALAGLLGAGRHTDMGAEEAVTDALTDIRLHELASMTAMQTAVRALVVRLGPDQIRDSKDQTANRALLGNRKARAWDAYEALHAEVLRGLSDDFDSVFGKRFALAYEQAMEELTQRKNPGDDWR
jgi:type VI secretion system FHA domain protein